MPTRPHAQRVAPWRNYADLAPAEKASVRRMYTTGVDLMAIAHRTRVYAGTVLTAALAGNWTRQALN